MIGWPLVWLELLKFGLGMFCTALNLALFLDPTGRPLPEGLSTKGGCW